MCSNYEECQAQQKINIDKRAHNSQFSHISLCMIFFFNFLSPAGTPQMPFLSSDPLVPVTSSLKCCDMNEGWECGGSEQSSMAAKRNVECESRRCEFFFMKALQCCHQTDNMKIWYIFPPTQSRANLTSSIFFLIARKTSCEKRNFCQVGISPNSLFYVLYLVRLNKCCLWEIGETWCDK